MPGYSRLRFVRLSEIESEEFTCGICLEIFKKPMVVQCCRQTYCNDCITEWLTKNEICPNDRQRLTEDGLLEPPRFVQNLISKLRIHCKFQNSGCDSIVELEKLEDHELNCGFNPNKFCDKCDFIIHLGEEHDCLTNLMATKLSLVDQISRLIGENTAKKAI
jgi:E3 ubiquitin-protein ligase NRDP1